MTSAFGKVILLGEHSVVYGHPAVAGAIDRRVRCTADVVTGPSRLEAPDWGLSATVDDAGAGQALGELCRAIDIDTPLLIRVTTDLPAATGLGSSAALSVACARALCEHIGITTDIEALADVAERCFHDNPSGVDVAIAARGGLGEFVRGRGLEPIDAQPLSIVVGLTGKTRNTADMVRRVRQQVEADEPSARERLDAMGATATRGRQAIEAGDMKLLGECMYTAHSLLSSFELSTPEIEDMVSAALERSALGAKLTGAGGGGAVIALAPGREQEIVQCWRDLEYEAFSCLVGVTQ